jgi:hypothetical protein
VDHEVFDFDTCRDVGMSMDDPDFFRDGPPREQCVLRPMESFGFQSTDIIGSVHQLHGVTTMYLMRKGGYIIVHKGPPLQVRITDSRTYESLEEFCDVHKNKVAPEHFVYWPMIEDN